MRKFIVAILLALVIPSTVSAVDTIRLDTTMQADCILVQIPGETCAMYDCCNGHCTVVYVC